MVPSVRPWTQPGPGRARRRAPGQCAALFCWVSPTPSHVIRLGRPCPGDMFGWWFPTWGRLHWATNMLAELAQMPMYAHGCLHVCSLLSCTPCARSGHVHYVLLWVCFPPIAAVVQPVCWPRRGCLHSRGRSPARRGVPCRTALAVRNVLVATSQPV